MIFERIFDRMRCAILISFFVIALPVQAADPVLTVSPGPTPVLVIDPDRTIRASIPARLFSINMQYNTFDIKHWERDQRRVKPKVLADLQSMRGSLYRYPGGLPSNAFQWEKSVLPYDERIANRKAEGNLSVNTYFGLGEYLQFIKDVSYGTPWYTLNLIGAGTLENPVELPAWQVALSNRKLAQYIVERTPNQPARFYQLGNELDRNQYQWSYTKYVNRSLATINRIMEVDPNARFVPFMREFNWAYNAPLSGQGKADEYFDVVMKGLPMVRDFSLHYYFDGKLSPSHPFLTVPKVIDKIGKAVAFAQAARSGYYNVWITEYGKRFYLFGNTPPESGTSLDAALAAGDFLIALAQMPVVRGAMLQGLDGGERMLYFDSNKPTASFWALRILATQPYTRVLASKTTSPNNSAYPGGYDVRTVAFTNAAGNKLGVSAVNRSRKGHILRVEYPPMANQTVQESRRFVRGSDGVNPKYVETSFRVQDSPIVNTKTFNSNGVIYVWLPALSVSTITFD